MCKHGEVCNQRGNNPFRRIAKKGCVLTDAKKVGNFGLRGQYDKHNYGSMNRDALPHSTIAIGPQSANTLKFATGAKSRLWSTGYSALSHMYKCTCKCKCKCKCKCNCKYKYEYKSKYKCKCSYAYK